MQNGETSTDAGRLIAVLLAELLRPAIVEAVREEVRAALEERAQEQKAALQRRWLSTSEAAEIAGVHAETIRRAIKTGRLPASKALGHVRINPDLLRAFLEGR